MLMWSEIMAARHGLGMELCHHLRFLLPVLQEWCRQLQMPARPITGPTKGFKTETFAFCIVRLSNYIACRQVHKASCLAPYHVESWLFFNCVLLFPVRPSWCLAGRRGRFNFTDADATLPSFQAKCYPHPEIWRHRQAIWPKRYVNLPHVKINPNQSKILCIFKGLPGKTAAGKAGVLPIGDEIHQEMFHHLAVQSVFSILLLSFLSLLSFNRFDF